MPKIPLVSGCNAEAHDKMLLSDKLCMRTGCCCSLLLSESYILVVIFATIKDVHTFVSLCVFVTEAAWITRA